MTQRCPNCSAICCLLDAIVEVMLWDLNITLPCWHTLPQYSLRSTLHVGDPPRGLPPALSAFPSSAYSNSQIPPGVFQPTHKYTHIHTHAQLKSILDFLFVLGSYSGGTHNLLCAKVSPLPSAYATICDAGDGTQIGHM